MTTRKPSEAIAVVAGWVDEHGDALLAYALSRLADRNTAEDLVQETFLAAVEAHDAFRGKSSPRTWLVGILRHKILDHFRARRGEAPAGPADPSDRFDAKGSWSHPPEDWDVDPAELAQRKEFWDIFQRCLERLPGRQDEAFYLRVIDGLTGREVCKILGISPTNLWVMLHRARARLRDCLEALWFAPGSKESA